MHRNPVFVITDDGELLFNSITGQAEIYASLANAEEQRRDLDELDVDNKIRILPAEVLMGVRIVEVPE